MSHSAQLTRQWKILRRLEQNRTGCTARELSDEHEVCLRTIRRDINALLNLVDITETTEADGSKRWSMAPLSQQLGLRHTDLISIVMSRRFLEPLAGTPIWDSHQQLLRKVKGALGDYAYHYCDRLHSFLQTSGFGSSDYTARGEMIDKLMLAMEERQRVLVVYQSMQATEPVEQELGPQGFVWHNGSLYLIAWSARRQEIRNYKLDRIESVQLGSNLKYEVPHDFCLEDWQQSAFGVWNNGDSEASETIRIQFARDAARYVQESWWHSSQQHEPQPDGSLILQLELNDPTAVIKWVLSFGRNATVLEPASLVNTIREELQSTLNRYPSPESVEVSE